LTVAYGMWWRLFPLFKQERTFESVLSSKDSTQITAPPSSVLT